jgi:hypothetical protein
MKAGVPRVGDMDGTGSVFEYRIPWSALNSTRAPRKGEKLTACIQCHWGTEKGDDLRGGVLPDRRQQRLPHPRGHARARLPGVPGGHPPGCRELGRGAVRPAAG